ncbi:Cytochrome P450 86A2 [Phytophthora cinnamomi]|uniref:Cytochrome P450 86A2 n=1 Tax=Phytophthora cinnamomi TaxID=4785 RepID=UPI00355A605A|nr:Cytochrome P450 86A2 [Phytophthora cinnamomi]
MLPPLQLSGDSSIAWALLAGGLVSVFVAASYAGTRFDSPDGAARVSYLPSWLPVVGNTVELATNVERFQEWVAERSLQRDGKPFALRLLGKNDVVYLARPEHFEEVLKTQSSNFNKSDSTREIFDDFLGEDIVLIYGKRWQFHRKILAGLFTTRALREYMTPIVQENVLLLQQILTKASKIHESFDASKLLQHFTMDTIAEIGFGYKLRSLTAGKVHPFEAAFDDANRISTERFTIPTWIWKLKRWLNVGSERRLREAIGETNDLLMKLISSAMERANNGEAAKNNIVSLIVNRMKNSGQEITPTEVRDISLAGLEAGRNTTADGMRWLFHALSHNPRVQAKLRAETRAKLPKLGESETYVPSHEDVQELPYLEATILELLRLYPPVPSIPYHCARDTVFADGTFIPANTDILLTLYSAGRLASVWGKDATKFSPERFLDEKTCELLKDPPAKYSAFSDGPRICLGRSLAMLELKVVVATVVGRFKLIEEPGQEARPILDLTIGMKNPLMLRVESALQQEQAASS